ncbi:DUF397 domain-containing protein [Actinomadura roseirufa]|uniref:DUF397 domain-containing protein n=1 Tax=Actinomadura roseirufa TaxID=2094049 RepID=UPI001040FCC3|nr:DUF397 domain-containing protein [Actinomadura roseirufa]
MSAPDWSHAVWRKSGRSNGKGNCVEVAAAGAVIGVRDSKNPAGPVLALAATDWHAFITAVLTASPARGAG